MLEARELRKKYGSREVVAGVSLSVAPGEIVGLLGPNGAGKTTTVSMLCGLVGPDSGEVTIGGERIASENSPVKRRIGLVPQDIALYEDLSALANLKLFGALYGVPKDVIATRAKDVLAMVGLSDRAMDKPATFSGGMKRRVNIACALIHDPDVLILDEPTVGVDPQSRNAIFDSLEILRERGKALVYTTHYMEEAERLCDRVIIVDHGSVVASDTLMGLYRRLPATQTLEVGINQALDLATLPSLPGVLDAVQTDGELIFTVTDLGAATGAVSQWLGAQGIAIRSVASGRANLEDVFLALTGRQLRD